MIGIGSRVKIKLVDSWANGLTGTVSALVGFNAVEIALDQPAQSYSTTVSRSRLMALIDEKRPVRFVGDHNRPCKIVGYMHRQGCDKVLLVDSIYAHGKPWAEPFHFLMSGESVVASCSLVIENVPERTSGFYPLDLDGSPTTGRARTTLDIAKNDYPRHLHFLEIVKIDGIVKETHYHAR